MTQSTHGFEQIYSSFSGADISAAITVPVLTNDPVTQIARTTLAPISIGNLHTISVSTHRDSVPVRAFKHINPKGFTRGARTVAGSLIFTMFDRESLSAVQEKVRRYYQQVHKQYAAGFGNSAIPDLIPKLHVDELPPFDVTVTMVNEFGQAAITKIKGVQIITNGVVAGVNELILEEQMSYIALEVEPVYPAGAGKINNNAPRMV